MNQCTKNVLICTHNVSYSDHMDLNVLAKTVKICVSSSHVSMYKNLSLYVHTMYRTATIWTRIFWRKQSSICISSSTTQRGHKILEVCCSVLQCVAVFCGVLQCVAVCCSVLHEVFSYCVCLFRRPFVDAGFQRRVAVCCRVLQCVAVCCSVLQGVAGCRCVLRCGAVCCGVLQGVAVYCAVVQCVVVCCMKSLPTVCVFSGDSSWTQDFKGVLQGVVVYCAVLQCVAVCCMKSLPTVYTFFENLSWTQDFRGVWQGVA